jgi:hypothetical protein
MNIPIKIGRLSKLLPGRLIKYAFNKIYIYVYKYLQCYPIELEDEHIVERFQIFELSVFLIYHKYEHETKYNVLLKYYSIVRFDPTDYPTESLALLNNVINEQKKEELLLEEVLKSKKNIDGLIENKIRSFIYYNIKLI